MSRFLNDMASAPPGTTDFGQAAVDFGAATQIEGAGGSTCDVFWQIVAGKKMFIKRLRKEYSYSSHHIAAYRKEFEAGRGFTDHRLPRYEAIAADGTWIAMDYFEGVTLERFYTEHPKWFVKRKNVERLLRELVEAVGYLHKYTFEHGDIKGDNVMISEDGMNVKLIDLDKCFSDALCTTKTAADKPSDFVALGQLAQRYGGGRFDRFIKVCNKPDATAEELIESLRPQRRLWLWPLLLIPAALVIWGVTYENHEQPSSENEIVEPTIVENSEPIEVDVPEPFADEVSTPETPTVEITETEPMKMDYKSVIGREIGSYFTSLSPLLDEVEAMLDADDADMAQMRDVQSKMIEVQTSCRGRAYRGFELRFPNENSIDVQIAVADASNRLPVMERFNALFTRLANRMIESGNQLD